MPSAPMYLVTNRMLRPVPRIAAVWDGLESILNDDSCPLRPLESVDELSHRDLRTNSAAIHPGAPIPA